MAAATTITNWFGDLTSHPRVVVQAASVDDIVGILKDPDHYPSPVRAVGSNHSTAPVGVADGGTLIQMSKMNRILEIGTDTVTVQAGATGDPDSHVWPLRNYMWAKAGPLFCSQTEANIADQTVRYKVIDGFGAIWRFNLESLIRSGNTVATDQIIQYPPVSDNSRYTFSLWAFPEDTYPTVLPEYFAFCKKYYRDVGYRNNMLYVGYPGVSVALSQLPRVIPISW
jgi:hypothetical protein